MFKISKEIYFQLKLTIDNFKKLLKLTICLPEFA